MVSRYPTKLSRRAFTGSVAAAGARIALGSLGTFGALVSSSRIAQAATSPAPASGPLLQRAIPASGEPMPVIGMGSWITFNVGDDKGLRDHRVKVLQAFLDHGGGMIDSSPMYGSAEAVIGYCLARISTPQSAFSATKVWTWGQSRGVGQMDDSHRLWGVDRFDLMQVHNLLDWRAHLETIAERKAGGQLRYAGITTSHGRRHDDFATVMATHPLDFVQLTYNIIDREAERRLLPLAAERGLAVIANRPFRRGALFDRFSRHPLPPWASEIDCTNWAQFFLKFVISHPAVTCAIPATSRVDHMHENMGAARGRLPDTKLRQRMIDHIANL